MQVSRQLVSKDDLGLAMSLGNADELLLTSRQLAGVQVTLADI
jgi:hypothetical protein